MWWTSTSTRAKKPLRLPVNVSSSASVCPRWDLSTLMKFRSRFPTFPLCSSSLRSARHNLLLWGSYLYSQGMMINCYVVALPFYSSWVQSASLLLSVSLSPTPRRLLFVPKTQKDAVMNEWIKSSMNDWIIPELLAGWVQSVEELSRPGNQLIRRRFSGGRKKGERENQVRRGPFVSPLCVSLPFL